MLRDSNTNFLKCLNSNKLCVKGLEVNDSLGYKVERCNPWQLKNQTVRIMEVGILS